MSKQPANSGGPEQGVTNASPLPESYSTAHLEDLDAPALRQNLSVAIQNLQRMHERFAQVSPLGWIQGERASPSVSHNLHTYNTCSPLSR